MLAIITGLFYRPKSLLENLFAESGDASACSRAERGVSLR
jgi:hypothetical protein